MAGDQREVGKVAFVESRASTKPDPVRVGGGGLCLDLLRGVVDGTKQ